MIKKLSDTWKQQKRTTHLRNDFNTKDVQSGYNNKEKSCTNKKVIFKCNFFNLNCKVMTGNHDLIKNAKNAKNSVHLQLSSLIITFKLNLASFIQNLM